MRALGKSWGGALRNGFPLELGFPVGSGGVPGMEEKGVSIFGSNETKEGQRRSGGGGDCVCVSHTYLGKMLKPGKH